MDAGVYGRERYDDTDSLRRNEAEGLDVNINRVWAMPNRWTFQIKPIAELLARYVGDGKGWIDPFAGMYSPAEFTNDLNPDMPTQYHLDALDFITHLQGYYRGILFDPPYSYQQMKECYADIGKGQITARHATNFYGDLRHAITSKIMPGGIAISCGWNSIGMGKTHGFEIIEILLICHGRAHNDTIVTVDRKIQADLPGLNKAGGASPDRGKHRVSIGK